MKKHDSVVARSQMWVVALAALIAIPAMVRAQGKGNDHWVGTWAAALHEPNLGVPGLSNDGFNNKTLRQIVHTSVGGQQTRVRLSTFGASQLVVGAAHIALSAGGAAIQPRSDRVLTFGGKSSITIPSGAIVLSDPVDLDIPALSDVAISIFVPGNAGPATWQFDSRQRMYVSPTGDFTGSLVMPLNPMVAMPLAWFWLAGVEVVASKQTGAVVAFGDSITTSSNSSVDANNRWPDQLARRLMDRPGNQNVAVLNAGIAGGRLLHDVLGPNGLARFERDALSQPGVTHVIVQIGNNDIFTLNPADELSVDEIIQGYKQLIERAHASGLKIFGCTLTPVNGFLVPGTPFPVFTPDKEIKRQAVNSWIRISGAYDAVIDFDQVLRDPSFVSRLNPTYDSGDHGHPTDAGYKALADMIDLKLFQEP